jgi:hypothetical protein
MNLVAADVRRLTHCRAKIVRASLRRLLRFKDSRRENFFLGSLILTVDRVRNRLKPELQTGLGTTPRGWELRALPRHRMSVVEAVGGQNEIAAGSGFGVRPPRRSSLPFVTGSSRKRRCSVTWPGHHRFPCETVGPATPRTVSAPPPPSADGGAQPDGLDGPADVT